MNSLFLVLAAAWSLTPDGYGPVKIGMTPAQVSSALHARLEGEPLDDAGTCIEMSAARDARPGMNFMFLKGRLARISLFEENGVTTPRRIGIGATAEAVRSAYGAGLASEPHAYIDPPGEYLTFWTRPRARGVRFEIGNDGKVDIIHAGTDAIQYVEGCA